MAQKAQATKLKINMWDYMKLKFVCRTKETINRVTRQSKEWKKIFINHIPEMGLHSK
jgi:hypothetical protein